MADRTVASTNTLNYFRHEFNGTAEDIGTIADVLSASSYIASSTDIVEAIVAINTELPEITTDAFVFPVGTMVWEGSDFNYLDSGDAYETTLSFTDPTADRTYTFGDINGDVVLDIATQTITNKTLTSPTINAGTLSGAFTGTADLTGTVLSGASPLVFEGATDNIYETTLGIVDPTADRTVSLPNATDTLMGKATTDTLTNKSIDLATNTLTGSLAEWSSALQSASFASLADTQTLTNKTFTSPTINGGTFSGSFTGTMDVTGTVLSGASPLVFEGATDDDYETTLAIVDPTADRVVTMPNATATLIGKATTDTLTNKSIDLGNNTLTGSLAEWNSALQSVSFVTLAGSETWTNKTLTSPTINGGTFSGAFTGTMNITGTVLSGASPLVFEGATADAYETTWAFTDPTADRTITVPNDTGTLIGKATTDTLTNKSVDLGNNTLTGSLAEFNSALQSASFVSLTGSETLTNKTLTSPTINGGTFSGTFTGTMDISGTVLSGASPLVFEGATDDGYETTWAFTDPTADRVITVPNATDTLIGKATTDTFTNKTIDLGSNTLTASLSEFNSALQSDSFGTLADTQTWTNKTFTSPTITSGVLNTGVSGTAVKDEDNMASNSATVAATQQSIKAYIDAQVTAQDLDIAPDSGSAQSIDLDSETLTFSGGTSIATSATSNTLTMTIDSAVMTLTGTQTLTNKTFTSPTINTMTFASGTSTSGMQIGSTGIVFEGATADAYETTLTVAEPTADRVITIPNSTMTLLTTATHANKANHIARCIALG